jgi:hypothetical protein
MARARQQRQASNWLRVSWVSEMKLGVHSREKLRKPDSLGGTAQSSHVLKAAEMSTCEKLCS